MSQGSIFDGTTTIEFASITPDTIPPLEISGRVSTTPGVDGGRYINIGKLPVEVSYTVIIQNAIGIDASTTQTVFDQLEDMMGMQCTLTVHERSNAYMVLNGVSLDEEILGSDGLVYTQTITMNFTRLL